MKKEKKEKSQTREKKKWKLGHRSRNQRAAKPENRLQCLCSEQPGRRPRQLPNAYSHPSPQKKNKKIQSI